MEASSEILMEALWQNYVSKISYRDLLFSDKVYKDHLAIIDLGVGNYNREQLRRCFEPYGFYQAGEGYLADKINDFMWMTHASNEKQDAKKALPQVVLADFRIDLLSAKNREIIHKYYNAKNNLQALLKHEDVCHYLASRAWPLPSYNEYMAVYEENPLLAWVLLNGRCVNHFGILINLNQGFESLTEYCKIMNAKLHLNVIDGVIKGNKAMGIEQSASMGEPISVALEGGAIVSTKPFVEFVWRYPKEGVEKPRAWNDYFGGFIAQNANKIIESITAS